MRFMVAGAGRTGPDAGSVTPGTGVMGVVGTTVMNPGPVTFGVGGAGGERTTPSSFSAEPFFN